MTDKKQEKLKKGKEKALGFFGEFKKFILRGNVMDLAVGVIIGGAFQGIVSALTKDFINPLINSIGGAEIAGAIKLPWVNYTGLTPEQVQSLSLNYGDFITAIINFVIMGFVLFMLLKIVNRILTIGKKEEEEKKEEAKPVKTDEAILLEEIRDLLKKQK